MLWKMTHSSRRALFVLIALGVGLTASAVAMATIPNGARAPQRAIAGGPKISGYEIVHGTSADDSSDVKVARAECPAGKKVLGGGVGFSVGDQSVADADDAPSITGDAWVVNAYERAPTSENWAVFVSAICAFAS